MKARVIFSRGFRRTFKKLSSKQKGKVRQRIGLFSENKCSPILCDHKLKGKYQSYKSINVSGDSRAVYRKVGKNIYMFVAVGRHSQLY